MALASCSAAHARPLPKTNPCAVPIVGDSSLARRAVEALKTGSLAVLIRHAEATKEQGPPQGFDKDNCEQYELAGEVRFLTAPGVAQLEQIREALVHLAPRRTIEVRSSPYCRTKQSATLLSESGKVVEDPRLRRANTEAGLDALIPPTPLPGGHRFFVTHGENIEHLTKVPRGDNPGDAMAILIDMANVSLRGKQRCLGYLMPEDWATLGCKGAALVP